MKLNKLPDVVIKNPFTNPTISTKFNKLKVFVKCASVTAIIGVVGMLGVYLNIEYEQRILIQEKMQAESNKIGTSQSSVIIDGAANIIVKENGSVPFEVAKKYATWIFESGLKYNLDPLLIMAVIATESNFDYKAMSNGNAQGLMQIIYSWHKEKTSKVGLFDPKNNIFVGAQILNEYSKKSSSDVETLLRYNGSLGEAPKYAYKVLSNKKKFEKQIMEAVVQSV